MSHCIELDVDGTLCRFRINKPASKVTVDEIDKFRELARELIARSDKPKALDDE